VTPRAKTAAESGANIAMPWQVNSVNLPRDERRRVRGTIRRDRGARAAIGGEADGTGRTVEQRRVTARTIRSGVLGAKRWVAPVGATPRRGTAAP